MKKKISIITLQNVRNYGSVLQALATQELFERLGCEVDFFNYARPSVKTKWMRMKRWTRKYNIIKKIIYWSILLPTFIKEDAVFKRFIKRYLKVQKPLVSVNDDFLRLCLDSDIYCTGSDQTWNSEWNDGIIPELFLNFVPSGKKKIAYAASMGKSSLTESEKEVTKTYLERYDAISVRESSAVDIIDELGVKGAVRVLDPTLQVERDYWLKFSKKLINEPYVLVYQLNRNADFDAYAVEFAKRKGWKLVRFCIRYDQMIKPGKALIIPEVENFVSYIANASCVITDSFHGTAFCINLNINFISIYPDSFSARLASILEVTGLQDRHLTDYNDFSFVDRNQIDFSYANNILMNERKKAVDFLMLAISN